MAELQTDAWTTLERVNTPPAQTWNYLRTNDISIRVPQVFRKGDVHFSLPQLFDRIECGMGQKVTDWVSGQAADSRYIEVRANEDRTEPIVVDVDAQAGTIADTGIMVRSGATARVVVLAHGESDDNAVTASLLRIVVEKGAHLELTEIVALPDTQTHLESVGISADDDATIEARQYLLGGRVSALGFAADLAGDRSRATLTTRYLGRNDETLDINQVVRQRGENTRANVVASGVLDGRATKALRSTIDLVHGCKGSRGDELETVLVTSDDVTNKTMPVILCDEDDVQGNHGATIGSIGVDEQRYLAARGLAMSEVEALYARAVFDDAAINAPTDASREAVLARAAEVLGDEVADDLREGLFFSAKEA